MPFAASFLYIPSLMLSHARQPGPTGHFLDRIVVPQHRSFLYSMLY